MTVSDAPLGLFESLGPGNVRESFTVLPGAGGGFAAVAVATGRRLAKLAQQPGQHNVVLEISEPADNCYVQCIVDAVDGVWVEAVSNDFLTGDAQIDEARERILLDDLGFVSPGSDAGPNYSQHIEPPVDWASVGVLLVTTLCDVYGASLDDELTLSIYPHEHL